VADDDGALDVEKRERLQQEPGLLERPPSASARTFAIAEAGAVEGDHAIAGAGAFGNAAGDEIRDHAAVAVQQDDWSAGAAIEVVQPGSIYRYESADHGVVSLFYECQHHDRNPQLYVWGHLGGAA
jgi:hypothetical protein